MEIVVGRRYRVTNRGGASEIVIAEADEIGDIFLPVTIVPRRQKLWLRLGTNTYQHADLVTIELLSDPPFKPRPLLGEGSIDLEELRRTFRDWDFSTGTY